MLRCFGNALLLALLLSTRLVKAVYNDEAYTIDWQRENIGDYQWVTEVDDNTLLVVSSFDETSLLCWLNKSNGEILSRQPIKYKAVSLVATNDSQIVLKSERGELQAFELKHGFDLGPVLAESIQSNFVEDFSTISIQDKELKMTDKEHGDAKILINDLPTDTMFVKFYKNANESIELLLGTPSSQYYYYELENNTLSQKWARDESLTDVQAYTYASVNDDSAAKILSELNDEKKLDFWQAYLFRVQHNYRRLKGALIERRFSVGSFVKDLIADDDEHAVRQRDIKFGLLKYLIIATRKGKIAALNSITGEKVWEFESGFNDIIRLDSLKNNSELVVFTKSGPSLVLDTSHIGAVPSIKRNQVVVPSTDIERLGDSDDFYVRTEQGFRVILRGDGEIHNNETYLLDHDKHGLNAFIIEKGDLKESWKLDLKPNEEIIAFAARDSDPSVSLGNILGNRTVLYKYLYPHLASYAIADRSVGSLSVHLVDTITGELLYTSYYEDGVNFNLPVNILFGEYWFIYTYFSSEPIPEQKISVVELYESLEPNTRVSNSSEVASALSNTMKPQIVTKAYFYPEVIKNMVLSKTKFGITTKAIILELENGQITYLPKYLLSARRREESQMSNDDKKEFMAAPYLSGIPINDHAIISHYRSLLMGSNSMLFSIPTNLESTSIVCNFGHDIFCTRISPSSQFDKLSPSFEKGKLISTILGLLFLCYFIRPLVDTKKLKSQWHVKG